MNRGLTRARLWRWTEVAAWARDAIGWIGSGQDAVFVAAVNGALELRRLVPRVVEHHQRQLIERILSNCRGAAT